MFALVIPIVIAVPIVPFDAVKVDAACSHTAYNVTVVYNAYDVFGSYCFTVAVGEVAQPKKL